MKRYLLLISVIIFAIASCKKDKTSSVDAAAQAANDDDSIRAYLTANNITATKDPSGVYYRVIDPGTGNYPTATSSVAVNYTGRLLTDGTIFADQPGSVYLNLSTTTQGFRIALQHINVGGTIQFFVPSGLGFGVNGSGSVGANENLMYTATLQGFN